MASDPAGFVELLELEHLAAGIFLGRSEAKGRERIYGGQVAAQAYVAAHRTVPSDHHLHSLHGYFIRAGDETAPIVFDVDRIRDGRSFTTRRVVARQANGAIFNLSCSFHRQEPDVEFALAMPALTVPAPEELPRQEWDDISDVRLIPDQGVGRSMAWIRNSLPDRLPDDPWIHIASIVYGSDHIPMDAIWAGNTDAEANHDAYMGASLDHSVWIHRPARADQWLLFDMRLQSLQGSRGVSHGTIHTADGLLVATVAQEGLLRKLSVA